MQQATYVVGSVDPMCSILYLLSLSCPPPLTWPCIAQGWVQSYGSRYVRPPLIFGDVEFRKPMTVREYVVAQQLTARPVKGMLTGERHNKYA